MSQMAVVVIDMLVDFVRGALKCERAQPIVPRLEKLLDTARTNGVPVIFVNDAHLPEIDAEFKVWGPHAIKGTPGAKILPELGPKEGDYVIEKRRYSGFYETGLDMLLRELKVDTLVLAGLHTNICVRHTTADAFYRNYKLVVLEDAVEAFTEKDHVEGLEYLKTVYGVQLTKTQDIKHEVEAARPAVYGRAL